MVKKNIILQTAVQLFLEHGYDQVSIDDIRAKCLIARGTFYIYFKNKEDLLSQIVLHTMTEAFDAIIAGLPAYSQALRMSEEMEEMCESAFAYFADKSDLVKLISRSKAFGTLDIEYAKARYCSFFTNRYTPCLLAEGLIAEEIEAAIMTRIILVHAVIGYVFTQQPQSTKPYKEVLKTMLPFEASASAARLDSLHH
jgi:AcrR family transcriptional regulator